MLSVLLIAPASAQSDPPPREYGESGTDGGVVTVAAGSEWLPTGSDGSGGSSSCTTSSVTLIVEDDFVQPVNREWRVFAAGGEIPFTASPTDLPSSLPTFMRHFSPTGRWYAASCDGVITVVPEGGPPVTIAGLMQQALDQVDPPEPELAVTPETLHFTQLQSWLAIEPAYWLADRRATAAAGRVQVTAVVTPSESIWDMGDGEGLVACEGPGTVWQPGLDDSATDCGYTYRTSSAGASLDAFELTATVLFNVDIETNAPGSYGPFDDIERETVESVQVGEIQAVNN
jgi:hypothetical protein